MQPAMAWLPCRWSLEVEKTVKTLKGIEEKKMDTDRGEKKVEKCFIRDNYSFESLREFCEWTMVRI